MKDKTQLILEYTKLAVRGLRKKSTSDKIRMIYIRKTLNMSHQQIVQESAAIVLSAESVRNGQKN